MAENDDIFAAVVDIETTGLNAYLDVPLEVGIKLIDPTGYVLDEFHSLVWEDDDTLEAGQFQLGVQRGRENTFVNNMHTKSGLWADLGVVGREGNPPIVSKLTRAEVDFAMQQFLLEAGVKPVTVPMMGNSTGSLDRPFTLAHFPRFNETLSYRNVDISTFKEVCKAVNPFLFENLKPIIGTKEDALHRVMDDIDACILEYRTYCQEFLLTDEEWS